MDQIISEWNDYSELEFKLFNISANDNAAVSKIKQIITELSNKKNSHIERSINCLQKCGDQSKVFQVIIGKEKGGKKTINKYHKNRLLTTKLDNIKVVLSDEIPIDDSGYKADMCDILRFRNRLSIMLMNNKWRLDITLIKSIHNSRWDMDILVIPIAKLLRIDGLDPTNYVDLAPWEYANRVEVELEYVNKSAPSSKDISEAIKFINEHLIESPDDKISYLDVLVKIAKLLQPRNAGKYARKEWGVKRLSNNVITLDIETLYNVLIPNINDYTVSPKIDGVRTILLLENGKCYAINDSIIVLPFGFKSDEVYIYDTEMFEDENNKNKITFFAFDCMYDSGVNVTNISYTERIKNIDKLVKITDMVEKKPILKLSKKWKKELKSYVAKKWPYGTDGLIFTPINKDYFGANIYKWKPAECMSIDFLYNKNTLHNGIKRKWADVLAINGTYEGHTDYLSVVFQPTYFPSKKRNYSNVKLKGVKQPALVELIWDTVNKEWKLLMVRQDRQRAIDSGKYFGNDHRIADKIWHSIFWPIKPSMLSQSSPPTKYKKKAMEISEDNPQYFKNIYKKSISDDVEHIIDAGTYYPDFSSYPEDVSAVDFLVSDGFSCLNIINKKYDASFQNNRKNKMLIHAYDPTNFDIAASDNSLLIAILPIRKQLLAINKVIESKISCVLLVHKKDTKILKLPKDSKVEKLSESYDIDDMFMGSIKSYLLITLNFQ